MFHSQSIAVLSYAYATSHTTGAPSSASVITPTTNEQRSLNTQVPTYAYPSRDHGNSNVDQNLSLSLIPRRPYSLTTYHSGSHNHPPRKFTVNGTIDNPSGLFYVKPDNDVLVAAIHNQDYIMVTGHRGSGMCNEKKGIKII